MFVISERRGVIVEMSYSEAQWLKAVMQNPLNGEVDPSKEDAIHQKHRHELFNALRNQIGNS